MSLPNPKTELHEQVMTFIGFFYGKLERELEELLVGYLHDEVEHPEKRSRLYERFIEFINEK